MSAHVTKVIAKVRRGRRTHSAIGDGDVARLSACTNQAAKLMLNMGGGAPEGVLAAAALRVIGGQMMGRLIFGDNQNKLNAKNGNFRS